MSRSSRFSRDDDIEDIAVKGHKSSDCGRYSGVPTSTLRSAWDEFLATKLFLKVPQDFYNVLNWRQLYEPKVLAAFIATLRIRLYGPFDLLVAANLKIVATDKPLYLHGRYYFDPLSSRAEEQIKKRQSTLGKTKVATLLKKIEAYIDEETVPSVKKLQAKRKKETVVASLHQLGIVVLSVARNRLSELVPRATIASDECDFGTSLLLGLDVFSVGSCLENEALQLLRVA
ncbi:hypothetical protein PsorP6_014036 [Peronosclerospora sorghi]|uniref:Uncharacterized protein n=1 Tax=Peronosclerospora sorghi TaxID=230839 RepID=A0ACC0VFZ0_9STRA|nr:hypothetical protein PsorP6_014036 [Peronosclerospora sorghi]